MLMPYASVEKVAGVPVVLRPREEAPGVSVGLFYPAGSLYGLWACGQCSHDLGRPDDGSIVWDEVIAFGWILLLIGSNNLWVQAITFLIFRFFDAAKPRPISRVDQYFKKISIHQEHVNPSHLIKYGFGIMIDDLIAALFTILIVILGIRWLT